MRCRLLQRSSCSRQSRLSSTSSPSGSSPWVSSQASSGGRQRETGLDAAPFAALAQQPCPRTALGAAQQGIKGIQQDRLARPRLSGEHGESIAERQLQAFDQGNVLQVQTREHPGLR